MVNTSTIVNDAIPEHFAVIQALQTLSPLLEPIGPQMIQIVLGGNEVLWRGNAGSAADAHHLTAKLVGRLKRERCAIHFISITTDTYILIAIDNNYGFERIFSRHIHPLCQPGNLFVGISTSGNSNNVCGVLRRVLELGAVAVVLIGERGDGTARLADIALRVPSNGIARVQEAHILYGYILCDLVGLSIARQETIEEGTLAA